MEQEIDACVACDSESTASPIVSGSGTPCAVGDGDVSPSVLRTTGIDPSDGLHRIKQATAIEERLLI